MESSYYFEYGTSTSYGSKTPATPKSIGAGTSDLEVDQAIASSPGVTYHYRLVLTNSKGTFYGEDKTFKTSKWYLESTLLPSSVSLRDVSCSSATDCVAVGSTSVKAGSGYEAAPFAAHWNGTSWSTMTTANPSGADELISVSCSAASSCVALGESSGTFFSEYWNGTSWTVANIAAPAEAKELPRLSDVSCTSATSCMAAGTYTTEKSGGLPVKTHTLVEQWDGKEWTLQPTPNAEGKNVNWFEGISCSSSVACTAVGGARKSAFETEAVPLVELYR